MRLLDAGAEAPIYQFMAGRLNTTMLLEGFYNPAHVVREFFLCEYAFEILWKGKSMTVRVAHQKGVWTLAKVEYGKVTDLFSIDDTWEYPLAEAQPSGLIAGFIRGGREIEGENAPSVPATRAAIARVLTNFIACWASGANNIEKIVVMQPGRNATIDLKGEFHLSPRKEDWKK